MRGAAGEAPQPQTNACAVANVWVCGPKLHAGTLSCELRCQLPIAAQRPPEAATLSRGTLWRTIRQPVIRRVSVTHQVYPGRMFKSRLLGLRGCASPHPAAAVVSPTARRSHVQLLPPTIQPSLRSGTTAIKAAEVRSQWQPQFKEQDSLPLSNTGNWTPRSHHHQLWIQRKVQLRPVSPLRHPPAWRWSRGSPRLPAGRARQESHRAFAWRM